MTKLLLLPAAALFLLPAAPASAAPSGALSDDGGAGTGGTCSGGARFELDAETDDGRLEVEGEVDSGTSGQEWAWKIKDNGAVVVQGTATTRGRSGSFSVERKIADRPGTDKVTFRATYRGQVCRGSVRL